MFRGSYTTTKSSITITITIDDSFIRSFILLLLYEATAKSLLIALK